MIRKIKKTKKTKKITKKVLKKMGLKTKLSRLLLTSRYIIMINHPP